MAEVALGQEDLGDDRIELRKQVVVHAHEASLTDGGGGLLLDQSRGFPLDAETAQSDADSSTRHQDHLVPCPSHCDDVLDDARDAAQREQVRLLIDNRARADLEHDHGRGRLEREICG